MGMRGYAAGTADVVAEEEIGPKQLSLFGVI